MTKAKRIYVASSWRNLVHHGIVVETLRLHGHEAYDFRSPSDDDTGFHWSDIDPAWEGWTAQEYRQALAHPLAQSGFESDKDALDWADIGVLVHPCGRSAHLELGYMIGQGKPCVILALERVQPELMALLASGGVMTSMHELTEWVNSIELPPFTTSVSESHTNRLNESILRATAKVERVVEQLPATYDEHTFIPNTGQELWWRDEGGLSSSTSCELVNGIWICIDADRPVSECFSRREIVPGESGTQGQMNHPKDLDREPE